MSSSSTTVPPVLLGGKAQERSPSGGTEGTETSSLTACTFDGSTDDKADDNVPPTADQQKQFGLLFPYTIKDVELSDKEDQPTTKGKRNVDTKLMSIGGLKPINIDHKYIRNWGNKEGIGLQGGTKAEHCVAIAKFVEQHRRMEASGRSLQQPETIFARTKINYIRLINVMAEDAIKARLINRGSQIGREELDNGVQADQDLFTAMQEVYNDAEADVDTLRWHVDWNVPPDPTDFQPVADWLKVQAAFKKLCKDYDLAHKRWKQSGFHDDFEVAAFAEFTNSKAIVYLHGFLKNVQASSRQSPLILEGRRIWCRGCKRRIEHGEPHVRYLIQAKEHSWYAYYHPMVGCLKTATTLDQREEFLRKKWRRRELQALQERLAREDEAAWLLAQDSDEERQELQALRKQLGVESDSDT